ncbi:HlyC/CorC family transporter [Thiohalobacter sp.]|uniref:HlyC/CorC family transporter n=1 Tax=Thiohalobacter sp. TaxID=2025948 RepID=UPI002638C346|nr:HlyC/CorC family transporter [Thiohalobacter sp.]
MDEIPLSVLFGALLVLILLSAFFSGSETGLMTLNRYRLRHLARDGHRGAQRALRLLERPDRLIGLILLGNNFVNILASSLSTIIALRLLGEAGIAIAAGLLTLVILIFAEVAPKTLAALAPERIAFPAAFVYGPLLKLLYPLVWAVNMVANALLRLIGLRPEESTNDSLSREELRTVVLEAGAMIPKQHKSMLLNLINLEEIAVEDIMIPRNEIVGVDLSDDMETIENLLAHTHYARMPVYEESIDQVIGILHMRNVLPLLRRGELTHENLRKVLREPYFVPEGTPLTRQLLNFQHEQRRTGLVVDEYGDILGMITLEDILEEIVGEFTTDPSELTRGVVCTDDGAFLVDGTASIRELNRKLKLTLPTDGPNTLNGLILEHMETIPEPGTSLLLAGHPVEIVHIKDNVVRTAKIYPKLEGRQPSETAH